MPLAAREAEGERRRADEAGERLVRRHELPAELGAQLDLELVELGEVDAAALRHEEVGVEDVVVRLRRDEQRGDEEAVDEFVGLISVQIATRAR